ncbi:hypothetical protein [Pseudoxanthomonas putridarboris]|uniref:Uncharacterized protein n=1 Tax=Pseudoxanthomonas putridarboris TaxID=752605 RepID=A0ABU9J123_9GAMM
MDGVLVRMKNAIGVLVASIVVGLGVYYAVFARTGLPSDEEMIGQYSQHKDEFHEVSRRYRDFEMAPAQSQGSWRNQPGTAELLKLTKIARIKPDIHTPYVPDDVLKKNGWTLQEDYLKSADPFAYMNKYGTLIVTPYPEERFFRDSVVHAYVWKGYRNFPTEPRVHGGSIYWENGSARIVDSLDRFPRNWKTGECVYRKIDSTWYIHLCNGH